MWPSPGAGPKFPREFKEESLCLSHQTLGCLVTVLWFHLMLLVSHSALLPALSPCFISNGPNPSHSPTPTLRLCTFHSLSEMIFEIPLDRVIFGWPAEGVFHSAHLFLFISLWH